MRALKLQMQRTLRTAAFLSLVLLMSNEAFALGAASKLLASKTNRNVPAAVFNQAVIANGTLAVVAPTGPTGPTGPVHSATDISQCLPSYMKSLAKDAVCVTDKKVKIKNLGDDKTCVVEDPNRCGIGVDVIEIKSNSGLSGLLTSSEPQVTGIKCGKTDPKYIEVASACGIGSEDCKYNTPECRAARVDAGIGACAVAVKEAKDAFTAFQTACSETNLGSAKQCLQEAKACYEANEDASDSGAEEEDEEEGILGNIMKGMGLGEEEKKKVVANKCSVLSFKDHQSQKRDALRALRDANESMNKLKDELLDKVKEDSTKISELRKEAGEIQPKTQEQLNESQEKAVDAARQSDETIANAQANKSAHRSSILQLMAKKAEAIGARASGMAQFAEGIIETTCVRTANAKAEEAYPSKNLKNGSHNYMRWTAIRNKFRKDEYNACLVQAESQKAVTYRKLGLEITAVDAEIANLNRQIESESTRANTEAQNKNAALARASQSQQMIYAQSSQQSNNIQTQMNELQQSQLSRQMLSSQQTQEAQARIDDAKKELENLGKTPKGAKSPFEAAGKFADLAHKVKSLDDATCKDEKAKLEQSFKDQGLIDAYNNGVNPADKDDGSDDSDSSEKTEGRE